MPDKSGRRVAGFALSLLVALSGLVVIGAGPGYAGSGAVVVKPPKGAAKPVAATGIGTKAAMDDPRCRTGKEFGVYGRWDSSTVGGGPICVVPLKKGADNGGATYPGVKADSIKVVVVLPSAVKSERLKQNAQLKNLATGATGDWADGVHDYLVSVLPWYETWGRDIDVSFYTSTGVDETAQRADAVAVKAMKPFAVLNLDVDGLDTLMAAISQDKILTNSLYTSQTESEAQVPYRWGALGDTDAAALASAEVLGKNLVGKKAEYAGDDLKGTTRKLGLVTIKDNFDENRFKDALGKYKGTIATTNSYVGNGSLGDDASAQEQAPTFVTRMKDAGVTTVVLFSDQAMIKAMMQQATAQEWFPEWFFTASGYSDLPILAQGYPKDQAAHAFGITLIPPYTALPPEITTLTGGSGALNWYFGPNTATFSSGIPQFVDWLLQGIHLAGPNLTPKTFQQGLFADPGKPKGSKQVFLTGYGRTTGLPYDAYSQGPADFLSFWMDPNRKSKFNAGQATAIDVNSTNWYMNEGNRVAIGKWPKNLKWFDESNSISEGVLGEFTIHAAPPCAPNVCPSTGATEPTVGTPAPSGFVAKATTTNAFAT